MLFLPIVYYGKRGLEADVFESYMRLAGYPVQVVPQDNGGPLKVVNQQSSIAVVSLGQMSPTDQRELMQRIRSQANDCVKIFVLSDGLEMAPDPPAVEVIQRPYHLSEVVRRIQSMTRDSSS